MSDLHLEFAPLGLPGGDTLLLAGDIALAAAMRRDRTDKDGRRLYARFEEFFFGECAKYNRVFYIMGNHEHYHGVFQDTDILIRRFLEGSKVKFLEKESVDLGNDTLLWGGTLWTNMDNDHPIVKTVIKRGMNDFNYISWRGDPQVYGSNNYKLIPDTLIADHNDAKGRLQKFLTANPDKKIVVMTHMAPCFKSVHPRFGDNNPINHFYYSELSEFVLNNPQIKVWVHGHTHDTFEYMIGGTRVLCNPRGYANPMKKDEQENNLFNINFTFEV